MSYWKHLSWWLLPLLGGACTDPDTNITPPPTALFEATPTAVPVTPLIREASGIAASMLNPGYLWVQEDSGRPTKLQLLNHTGQVTKTVFLAGTVNRDWEDLALAGGDLFIGDIGDNNRAYSEYTFYHFPEPAATVDTVKNAKLIRFQYPDGPHDAEAFLVDPTTKDILILTKQENPARIYKLAFPYNYSGLNAVTLVGTTKYTGLVSAAVSPDGRELLLKTYLNVYHYTLPANETTAAALQKEFTMIPYQTEPQGEALTFAADNAGFYTLSEKGLANTVDLFFYKRK